VGAKKVPVVFLSGQGNRLREGASQAVFARYLNGTNGLIGQCECGEKRPQGTSLRLPSRVSQKGLALVA
jgi:putative transcriptional regulator